MILIGISGLVVVFLLLTLVDSIILVRIILLFGGMFWACININAYPYIVATGGEHSFGTRTGLYYLVSSLAAIISPPTLGFLIDLFGFGILFYAATLSMLIAFLLMLKVKSTEIVSIARE